MYLPWELIAHERRETLGSWGPAGFWVRSLIPGAQIIPRLSVPVDPVLTINPTNLTAIDYNPLAVSNAKPNPLEYANQNTLLLQVPKEILLLVSSELDIDSLYTLCHCCRDLCRVLLPEVNARFGRMFAPWANTPLICAGDHMQSNPPGIETRIPRLDRLEQVNDKEEDSDPDYSEGEEESEPDEEYEDSELDERDLELIQESSPMGISSLRPTLYRVHDVYHLMKLLKPINVSEKRIRIPTINSNSTLQDPNLWFSGLEWTTEAWTNILSWQRYFPPGRLWVLRNLTQKEYVYAHVLTSMDGHGGGKDKPGAAHKWGFNFGTVVMVNTCWSPGSNESFIGLNTEGRWAGNRFDIVIEDKLKEDMILDSRWVDVSRREWEAMVSLFKQNWDMDGTVNGRFHR